MSGVVASMAGDFSAGVVALSAIVIADVEVGVTAVGTVTVNRAGTISYAGGGSSGPAEWYVPSGGTPGDAYFVSLTLDSGDSWTTGAATSGTGIALTSNRAWSWSAAPVLTLSATCTLRIATDSGMTNVVASATVSVTVEADI